MNINQILPTFMERLKGQNINNFNMITNLMRNGNNPNAIITQMLGNMSPQAKQQLLNQAKNYGCPDKFLSQLQNLK